MKKYIAIAALLAAGSAFANAAYVWTGTSSSDWADASNWTLTDGSTWTEGSNGPGTKDSNMWDEILFDGGKYNTAPNVPKFEGWNLKVRLVNKAQITLTDTFYKFQNGGNNPGSYFDVDSISKLVIDWQSNYDNGQVSNIAFNISSYEGLEFKECVFANSGTFNINLSAEGSVKADWSLSGNINILFSADLKYSETNGGQYTYEVSDDGCYRIVTRVLWENRHDNGGLINGDHKFTLDGETLVKSNSALEANADSLGKYYIEKVTTDTVSHNIPGANIVVRYVEAIPEPSTFGLLAGLGALALVGTRRRRK